jgi:putative membrane protein
MSQLSTVFKGMAMGMAEVVPGVSGGTIAFITGIYERLIFAIKSVDVELFQLLAKGKVKAAWQKLDGNFLSLLLGGMVLGIAIGVFAISWLLEHQPIAIWSFFFGLILASCYVIGKDIKQWNWATISALILGTLLVYYVTVAVPSSGNTALWFVFLCGMVAISALLLPGLSGSFILLLLGMYTYILPKVKDLLSGDLSVLPVLITFGVGCLAGLLSFSRVLTWAFKHFEKITLAFLTGLMIGSLNKVWPWQKVLATRISSEGEETVAFTKSVLPSTFEALPENFLYGTNPQLGLAISCMLGGLILVLAMSYFGKK